jgi:PIN domain nuclease of toxin-antitoxin system
MTLYVCDTHALIWRLLDDRRLGSAAGAAFDSADAGTATIHIPAVVLAEMLMVAEKQRVAGWTRSEVELLVDAVSGASNYVLTELTPSLVLRSAELTIVPDIFDRLIATEAIVSGGTLISRDPVFASCNGLITTWN